MIEKTHEKVCAMYRQPDKHFNDHLVKLWEEFSDQIPKFEKKVLLMPGFSPQREKHKVLLLGINPSFSIKGWEKIFDSAINDQERWKETKKYFASLPLDKTNKIGKVLSDRFSWENFKKEKECEKTIGLSVQCDVLARDYYDYFKPINDLEEKLRSETNSRISGNRIIETMDLFSLRLTNSKDTAKALGIKKNGRMSDFTREHLGLSVKYLFDLEPNMIIAANAQASKILGCYFQDSGNMYKLTFSNDYYCYVVSNNKDNKDIPIFFSSQLTGGATSKWGKKQLFCHIRSVFMKIHSY